MTSELRPICDCPGGDRKVVKTKSGEAYLKCKCGAKSPKYELHYLLYEGIMLHWSYDASLEQMP
jgi:hypothetical protein